MRSLQREGARESGADAASSTDNENSFFSEACVDRRSASVHVSKTPELLGSNLHARW